MLKKYWYLFAISMLPIVELRGGVPIGVGMGFPFWQVYLVCVLGNLLPVPFLLLFGRKLLDWLATWPYVGGFFQRVINKADKAPLPGHPRHRPGGADQRRHHGGGQLRHPGGHRHLSVKGPP